MILTEYMIFRQTATSWSYIHLVCQKRWHKSFFWAKCLTTQFIVHTRILLMVLMHQRAPFLEVIRDLCHQTSPGVLQQPPDSVTTAWFQRKIGIIILYN